MDKAQVPRAARAAMLWVSFLLLCPLLCFSVRAQELFVSPEQDVLSRMSSSSKNISSADVFGDAVNFQSGDLSFRHVDIEFPGQGPNISIARTFQVSGRSAWNWRHQLEFADWGMEIPHISTNTTWHAEKWHVLGDTPTARCTAFGPAANEGTYTAQYWWQGVHLNVPGTPQQELMLRHAENTTIPSVSIAGTSGGFNIVTRDNWAFTCLPTLIDGALGEGFIGVAPNGTKYWFNKLVTRFEAYESEEFWSSLMRAPRRRAMLYVTRVEDKFGNYVDYNYQNNRISSIVASDGRTLQFHWSANRGSFLGDVFHIERIVSQPGQPSERAWTYSYVQRPQTGGTNVMPRWDLQSHTLPDGSHWNFSLRDFSNNCYDNRDAPGCRWEWPGTISGQLTAPSGLTATFTLSSGVAFRKGQYAVSPPATAWEQANLQLIEMDPVTVSSPRLLKKSLLGGGVNSTWEYRYTGEVLVPGQLAYAKFQVLNPDRSLDNIYVDSAWGSPTEGQVVRRERFAGPVPAGSGAWVGNGPALSVESFEYIRSAARVGIVPRSNSNSLGNEYRWLVKKHTIQQDGIEFVEDNLVLDALDRPVSIKQFNSAYSRIEGRSYHDDLNVWSLGNLSSVTVDGKQAFAVDFTWKAVPWRTYEHGKLKSVSTYDQTSGPLTGQLGTLKALSDGNGHQTIYSNWKRGVPQSVKFPSTTESPQGSERSFVVNDYGWIKEAVDEDGSKTCHEHDMMGRVTKITYPSESSALVCDSSQWLVTNIELRPMTANEWRPPGVEAGQWRQYISTGNYQKLVYFDGLLRPILSNEFDAASTSASLRSVSTTYDHEGRPVFTSYPSSDIIPAANGIWTFYDALGRVKEVRQDSEQGQLITRTEYLGLQRRVTDPNDDNTSTTYQAFEQPSYELPVLVEEPVGRTTRIPRDVFGKPLQIERLQ